jgi:glyoxylase-like metal-dependent hydrolase (beta-lactamase superfamily II)
MVPHQYGVLINGKKFTSMKVTRVSTLESEVDAFLNLPVGSPEPRTIEIPANRDAAANATVESIADGVYRVKNLRTGFHMLFVEFESSLLAVDAPTGYPLLNELPAGDVAPGDSQSWLSQRYIQLMKETVPGKPVKYVVLTHFHNDHAGGLFAFADSRTHVLVAESEIPAVHEWLGGSHTLCGPQHPDGNLVIDAVKKRRVIKDASQHVEILDVGENPHSAHMLVIWLPKHKLLYVADLLTADDGRADQHHDRLNQHFLGWLRKMRLEPEMILTAHGSGIVYTGEATTRP